MVLCELSAEAPWGWTVWGGLEFRRLRTNSKAVNGVPQSTGSIRRKGWLRLGLAERSQQQKGDLKHLKILGK